MICFAFKHGEGGLNVGMCVGRETSFSYFRVRQSQRGLLLRTKEKSIS